MGKDKRNQSVRDYLASQGGKSGTREGKWGKGDPSPKKASSTWPGQRAK